MTAPAATGRPVVLHVAPHPDDELLGAPGTLLALRDAGWRVVTLACSLGTAAGRDRRAAELEEACARVGFEPRVARALLSGTPSPSRAAEAERALAREVAATAEELEASIVVSPSPHDRHPRHEAVGRAVVRASEQRADATPLWMWGLWADLALPTMAVAVPAHHLEEAVTALESHASQLARADLQRLTRARPAVAAVLGPERIFGFGATDPQRVDGEPHSRRPQRDTAGVELLCEVAFDGTRWLAGTPRWLDPTRPFAPLSLPARGADLGRWLLEPSLTGRFGPPPLATPEDPGPEDHG